eukprot:ctg_10.g4
MGAQRLPRRGGADRSQHRRMPHLPHAGARCPAGATRTGDPAHAGHRPCGMWRARGLQAPRHRVSTRCATSGGRRRQRGVARGPRAGNRRPGGRVSVASRLAGYRRAHSAHVPPGGRQVSPVCEHAGAGRRQVHARGRHERGAVAAAATPPGDVLRARRPVRPSRPVRAGAATGDRGAGAVGGRADLSRIYSGSATDAICGEQSGEVGGGCEMRWCSRHVMMGLRWVLRRWEYHRARGMRTRATRTRTPRPLSAMPHPLHPPTHHACANHPPRPLPSTFQAATPAPPLRVFAHTNSPHTTVADPRPPRALSAPAPPRVRCPPAVSHPLADWPAPAAVDSIAAAGAPVQSRRPLPAPHRISPWESHRAAVPAGRNTRPPEPPFRRAQMPRAVRASAPWRARIDSRCPPPRRCTQAACPAPCTAQTAPAPVAPGPDPPCRSSCSRQTSGSCTPPRRARISSWCPSRFNQVAPSGSAGA